MDNELKEEVRVLIANIAELEPEEVADDAQFLQDLDLNSMLLLEILAELEKNFKIKIPEDELKNLMSLNATVEITEKYRN